MRHRAKTKPSVDRRIFARTAMRTKKNQCFAKDQQRRNNVMIYKMYAIRDKKSEFAAPVPIRDHEGAIRWFDHEIKTKEFMKTYADDFDLYCVGTLDTENGHMTGLEIPELVISGEEVNYGSKENNAIPNAG